MLSMLFSSMFLIFGIVISVFGIVGLVAFIFIIFFWINDGELGYEGNNWLFVIIWFVVSLFFWIIRYYDYTNSRLKE